MISGCDFPQTLEISFHYKDSCKKSIRNTRLESILQDADVVWNHRTVSAEPHPEISKYDRPVITDSSRIFFNGMLSLLDQDAFMVNPLNAKNRFGNKIQQLRTALQCGFNIPETLISNNYQEIAEFVQRVRKVVVKPINFMKWDLGERSVNLLTTPLTAEKFMEFSSVAYSACPMIYQEQIEKKYEYRIVVFGEEIVSYRIDSQQKAGSQVDWRAISHHDLPVRHCILPAEIESLIRKFMHSTGFVTGSFDLAEMEDGRFIFFECNESGQFLWLEQLAPEIPLLDMFSSFLLERRRDFRYDSRPDPLRFQDWYKDAKIHMEASRKNHVPSNLDMRYKEFETV